MFGKTTAPEEGEIKLQESNSWKILLLRKERESEAGAGLSPLPGPFWKESFGSLMRPFSSVNPIALSPEAAGIF